MPAWNAVPAAETARRKPSMFNPASVARQPSLKACWDETAANAAADRKQRKQAPAETMAVAPEYARSLIYLILFTLSFERLTLAGLSCKSVAVFSNDLNELWTSDVGNIYTELPSIAIIGYLCAFSSHISQKKSFPPPWG